MAGIRIVSDTISPKLLKVNKELNSRGKEVVKRSLKYGKKQAQLHAPYKSGKLRAGIHYRVYKNRPRGELYSIARGATGFPYNRFVNKEFPITIRKPNRYFKIGQTFTYGQSGVLAPSGREIMWSKPGSIGFMNQAFLDMKRHFWSELRRMRKVFR